MDAEIRRAKPLAIAVVGGHVVRCDAVAIRVLGVSLAGWNAILSLVITGLAGAGAWFSTRSADSRALQGTKINA